MSGAHVPDVHASKTIKCENPFPNWNPITKISYLELDIIVSRLVYSKAINWLMESSNINIINHFWRLILMIHTCLIDELLCMINNAIALSMLLSFREWVNTIIKIQKTNIFLSMFQCKINGDYTYVSIFLLDQFSFFVKILCKEKYLDIHPYIQLRYVVRSYLQFIIQLA